SKALRDSSSPRSPCSMDSTRPSSSPRAFSKLKLVAFLVILRALAVRAPCYPWYGAALRADSGRRRNTAGEPEGCGNAKQAQSMPLPLRSGKVADRSQTTWHNAASGTDRNNERERRAVHCKCHTTVTLDGDYY